MKINYTSKWLFQKIFAVLFLITAFYVIYSLTNLELENYIVIKKWFKNYFNSLSVLILFTSIFLHSNIGLTSIIDDYIHDELFKTKISLLKNFFFAVLFFITISSLVGLIINE